VKDKWSSFRAQDEGKWRGIRGGVIFKEVVSDNVDRFVQDLDSSPKIDPKIITELAEL
jgi:hypothetical protein